LGAVHLDFSVVEEARMAAVFIEHHIFALECVEARQTQQLCVG
jgi:hypothetical protein